MWVLLTLVLALFVPQISYVINPIGGLAAILMFVFPGLVVNVCIYIFVSGCFVTTLAMSWLHLTLVRRKRHGYIVSVLCGWLLILGTFIFGTSVVYNIMNDFHKL